MFKTAFLSLKSIFINFESATSCIWWKCRVFKLTIGTSGAIQNRDEAKNRPDSKKPSDFHLRRAEEEEEVNRTSLHIFHAIFLRHKSPHLSSSVPWSPPRFSSQNLCVCKNVKMKFSPTHLLHVFPTIHPHTCSSYAGFLLLPSLPLVRNAFMRISSLFMLFSYFAISTKRLRVFRSPEQSFLDFRSQFFEITVFIITCVIGDKTSTPPKVANL